MNQILKDSLLQKIASAEDDALIEFLLEEIEQYSLLKTTSLAEELTSEELLELKKMAEEPTNKDSLKWAEYLSLTKQWREQ